MLVYLLVACDGLDDKQEKKLKRNLPALQALLQACVEEHPQAEATLINECLSDDCEDWQLGISLPVQKKAQLKVPVKWFNELARDYRVDCEVGAVEQGAREPVSYFGYQEGQGDAFLIGEYLGL